MPRHGTLRFNSCGMIRYNLFVNQRVSELLG